MISDLVFAVRSFRRSPGFTLAALMTLALGLGANCAIFAVVLGVLLRPLPLRDPDRLVWVGHLLREQGVAPHSFSPQDFDDLRGAGAGLASAAAYDWWPGLTGMNLTGGGDPLRLSVAWVSGEFFPTLGAATALGRTFAAAEDVPGRDRVVVLSHRLWRGRFGEDPSVVGRAVTLDSQPFTVVGVMPPAFELPSRAVDAWIPLSRVGDDQVPHRRGIRWLEVVGRLAPGVSIAAAQSAADALFGRLEKSYPDSNEGYGKAAVEPLQKVVVGDVKPALLVLVAAVGLVLLIACANLANLFLARATARRREIALRAALGAGRWRLARQVLSESVLLAVAGGLLALLVAGWCLEGLASSAAGYLPRLDEVRLDGLVMLFTLSLAVLTGLAFGLPPALQAAGIQLLAALKEERGGSGASGGRGIGLRGGLVMAETALGALLLIGAGLLLRSFVELQHVEPGFRAERVLSLSVTQSGGKYDDERKLEAVRGEILRRLASLPGVLAVGASKTVPLQGGGEPMGFGVPGDGGAEVRVLPRSGGFIVSPGYFRALGIPIVRGRAFTPRDGAEDPSALIVNQALARQVWPGEDPVGKRVSIGRGAKLTVVGVAGDVRNDGLSSQPAPALYVPMAAAQRSTMKLFVRTAGDPAAVAAAVRTAIWDLDPELPISEIATLGQVVAAAVEQPRLLTLLVSLFGAVAVALAALGTYGVISYAARQRTREIGIRMALGADRREVVALVVRRGTALSLAGLAIGLLAALGLTRLLAGLLYGVSATDLPTFAVAALLVAAVALLASYLPARQAAGVDPLLAIRAE
ncbi:MAG TPA: ABC transporter permease [Thermoanaerobaculia bacterium]|nr:ABC transporter permease [Thermoanaerobaculia bacterium]